MAGSGVIAAEILDDVTSGIDYLFVPIGFGSLAAAMAIYFKEVSPNTKIIGIEPLEVLIFNILGRSNESCIQLK